MTPEQFADRFGASQDDVDTLTNWLRGQGFSIISTARSRTWVAVSGTAAQVKTAFHTEVRRYRVNGRMHIANATPPSVPRTLERLVSGIRGLDDFYLEHVNRSRPLYTAANGTHALSPGDLANIYNLFLGFAPGNGSGQSIVIAGDSDIKLADIATFRSTFSLSPHVPQTILAGADPGVDGNGGLEEAEADIEWAGAMAHEANIVYIYSANVLDAVQAAVDQNLAPVIGLSYGTCELNLSASDAQAIEDIAQQANAQGITWLAASGDGGAAGCDQSAAQATRGLSVWFPASLPEVTAIGATEFNEGSGQYWSSTNNPDGTSSFEYIPEIAWNDTSVVKTIQASGGGASTLYTKPSWQSGPGVPTGNARYVPDVSMAGSPNHDPYLVVSGGRYLPGLSRC